MVGQFVKHGNADGRRVKGKLQIIHLRFMSASAIFALLAARK